VQLNPGRVSAVAIGAHAGWFHRVNGRWPADFAELLRLDCPRLEQETVPDANFFGSQTSDARQCNVLSELPYEVGMQAQAEKLKLVVSRDTGVVCRLTVLAPAAANIAELSPMIRLRLLGFKCPGEGKTF
jgi:hypothetical protein